jgi:transposase
MKGLEPSICKKFRKIFKNAGYKTFLINEFRTSKLCNCCHNELDKFMIRPSKKPKLLKENKNELVNGLLRCQSIKPKCEIIHNRDKNAVINMLSIVKSVFDTGLRPKQFIRNS